eukprot:258021-Rhodomonas_salina.4
MSGTKPVPRSHRRCAILCVTCLLLPLLDSPLSLPPLPLLLAAPHSLPLPPSHPTPGSSILYLSTGYRIAKA